MVPLCLACIAHTQLPRNINTPLQTDLIQKYAEFIPPFSIRFWALSKGAYRLILSRLPFYVFFVYFCIVFVSFYLFTYFPVYTKAKKAKAESAQFDLFLRC